MHVVVLGGGYAGLSLARSLESSLPDAVDVTLVDERETHLVQHLVHRAIREPGIAEAITIPFSEVLSGATHRQARVTGIDRDAGVISLRDGSLEYDLLANCLGARTAFYDLPGVEEHATPLKRLEHALAIRERFLEVREEGGRVVVAGAGLSGIQTAGELAELARSVEADSEVLLLEQRGTVAPEFSEAFQEAVTAELTDRGVTVRTGTAIQRADADALTLDSGETLACDQLVWTGGITGQDAVGERPQVRATLQTGEDEFTLGDTARVVDVQGTAVPATAQTAIRQADVAATNIERLVWHRLGVEEGFEPRLDRYVHTDLGWLVSVGDGTVAQVGSTVSTGMTAKMLKTSVGAGYLSSIGAVTQASEFVRKKMG